MSEIADAIAGAFTCDTPTKPKLIECYHCGRRDFQHMRALRKHWVDDHGQSPRGVTSKDRPPNRGPHACDFPGCGRSFAHPFGLRHHRKDAHGIGP